MIEQRQRVTESKGHPLIRRIRRIISLLLMLLGAAIAALGITLSLLMHPSLIVVASVSGALFVSGVTSIFTRHIEEMRVEERIVKEIVSEIIKDPHFRELVVSPGGASYRFGLPDIYEENLRIAFMKSCFKFFF